MSIGVHNAIDMTKVCLFVFCLWHGDAKQEYAAHILCNYMHINTGPVFMVQFIEGISK